MPIDEEYNEKVVRIPESLIGGFTYFLSAKEYHDTKTSGHDPTGNTGARGEIYAKERQDSLTRCRGRRISHGKPIKVYHMGQNVDNGKPDYGPASSFVERDAFIEGNHIV